MDPHVVKQSMLSNNLLEPKVSAQALGKSPQCKYGMLKPLAKSQISNSSKIRLCICSTLILVIFYFKNL